MKSKEAIERHIKELLSEMTVEEKLDELDPNIMGIDWEKIEEPMRRECLEKLEKRRADARVYNALQKYAKEQTRLGIPFLFHEEALHGLHRRDATIFPQQLTLAGAFEPALCEDMGRMVAAETRAKIYMRCWLRCWILPATQDGGGRRKPTEKIPIFPRSLVPRLCGDCRERILQPTIQ